MKYTADFETVNNPDDCRVWAWAILSLDETEYYIGTCIQTFMIQLEKLKNPEIYFHNLRFDGSFILYELFKTGFIYSKKREPKTFNTLISDMNQFYEITVTFKKKGKKPVGVRFFDSAKIIPLKIEQIPKAFGMDIEKLEIDYNVNRPVGYQLTEREKEYLKRDVTIAARALRYFFEQGLEGMTIGSIALKDFKKTENVTAQWQNYFPMSVELDGEIRQAYKGAFTYVKESELGKEQKDGLVFDVNSLYPSVMYYCKMPYGTPIKFAGKYKPDNIYDYYFQIFTCSFELKKGMLPTLQLKNNMSFIPTEYVKSSKGEEITLCMTCTDLELFFEHYNIYNVEYHVGYKFRSTDKLFKEFIDKWIAIKNQSTIEGNKGMRTIAKLMLNNLYGKFASRPTGYSKIPYFENEEVKYKLSEEEERPMMYVPIGAAITAYARAKTIRAAQANYDRFIYADTDSLHLKGTKIPDNIEIDDVMLGAWKHESTFTRAKFLRAKSYIEEINGKLKVTCAGLPESCHHLVTWENFELGTEYFGKLQQKKVKGGIILQETTFKLKG